MASCTFFGHKECEIDNPIDKLLPVLANLIMNKGVDTFYVGNQGDFDKTVLIVLRRFQTYFTHIKFSVVLAYHPFVKSYSDFLKAEETVFPEELENIHPRFAISKKRMDDFKIRLCCGFCKASDRRCSKIQRACREKGVNCNKPS